MKLDRKKVVMLIVLTLLVTSLILVGINLPTTALPTDDLIYLHGPPLTPIHLNSNITLTPIHMHSKQGLLLPPLSDPIYTEWHELYPDYCQNWTLTSWNDTGEFQGELDPNDQIDMFNEETGETEWYHVDRITVTLLLSGPYEGPWHEPAKPTMAIELKWPWYDPYIVWNPNNTMWHEVWPNYSNVYNITNWIDDPFFPSGNLSFCDSIDLTDINTGNVTSWHVEDVATDLILRWKMMDPIGTWWHEVYPEYCNWHNLTSWESYPDPFCDRLSPQDQIDMMENESGITTWYFVDRVTVTINVSNVDTNETMKLELKTHYFEEMYFAFKHPVGSLWHEVYPNYSNVYNLTWWDPMDPKLDNCNGVLDPCDYIWLLNMTSFTEELYHIEDMTYDIILNEKIDDPTGIIWHELYPDCCIHDYDTIDWEDNDDGLLSPCDNVTLVQTPTDLTERYHVENMTLTLNLTIWDLWGDPPFAPFERIYIEYVDAIFYDWELLYYPKIHPNQTDWEVVCPTDRFGYSFSIEDWYDNCNGVLSWSDVIELVSQDGGMICHVDEVAVDITVKKITEEPPPPPPVLNWKANYTDYAPSGMPDFDQNQTGNYTWQYQGTLSHCAPAAEANSLWWYDSLKENGTTPPPTMSDNFNLVTSYNPRVWDDHDPRNVQPLVEHLAYLMDTDGLRTLIPHLGTNVTDIQTGITHYLSWTGVNPQGDVNGDGIVDLTDLNIVTGIAWPTVPGAPGWDMRADIFPVTTGWPVPGVADNIVDINDWLLVINNMNATGMFYEHTMPAPDFQFIEEEVERCQDVVLLLGFWEETGPDEYYRWDYPYPFGHAVTVAGINSSTLQIAISDPAIDAFELGLAPGRSPAPHAHIPPWNTTTHNNASLVSHDIYNVTFNPILGMWELENYPGYPLPMHVMIENAVIISPLEEEEGYGVEITNVTVLHRGRVVSTGFPSWINQVNVTVHNNGTLPINCTVNAYYYNATKTYQIGTPQNISNLNPCNSVNLTFTWDLAGLPPCNNFTVKANVTATGGVSDEYVNGQVNIRIIGDVDGDSDVDGGDQRKIQNAMFAADPQPLYITWNTHPTYTDLDCDGDVDGGDQRKCQLHMFEFCP